MRLSDNQGFTFVELMIALAISGIISAAMYSAYTSQQRVNQAQDQVVAIQQDLRAGLDMIVRELRMAGYDPDKKWGAGFIPSSMNGTVNAVNAETVSFTMIADDDQRDNDDDGETDEAGELKAVQFLLYDGYGDGDRDKDGVVTCGNGIDICDIGRRVGKVVGGQVVWGNPIVLIENVDRLEFYYTLVGGSKEPAPSETDLTGNKIRSIQISVLVRASQPSLGYLDTESYTSASGVDWTPPPDAIFPSNFSDDRLPQHFRRRMQVITVYCRNMGW